MKPRPVRVERDLAYVPLTRGQIAILDAADVHLVIAHNWHVVVSKDGSRFAARHASRTAAGRPGKLVKMHRLITGEPAGLLVNHVDGDSLNNRRSNLRLASAAQSGFSRGVQNNNRSGVKGVYFCKQTQRWRAEINAYGKRRRIGRFDTIAEAARAYEAAARELHGQFAPANNVRL